MPEYTNIFQGILGVAGVPVIIALVQWFKESVKDLGKYNNVIAMVIGIAIQIIGIWTFDMLTKQTVVSAVFVGVIAGLMASGFYTYKKVK